MKKRILLPLAVLPVLPVFFMSCSNQEKNDGKPVNPVEPVHPTKREDTDIKNVIDSKELKWEDKSINIWVKDEFLKRTEDQISKFVLDNKKTLFLGDVSFIENENDLNVEIENEPVNETTLFLTITIKANKWFQNNEVQTKELKRRIEINNFKPLPEKLSNAGGTLINSKLTVDKYKNIMDLFDLKENMAMTELNNAYFNDKLKQTSEFKEFKIEIKEGSTNSGILKLNLTGIYKSQQINDNITVNGFLTLHIPSNVIITNLNLNESNWFENKQPIAGTNDIENKIKKITSDDWINKYINNFNIYDTNDQQISDFKTEIKDGVIFNIQASSVDINKKQMEFTVKGTYNNKQYDHNTSTWVKENNSKLEFESVAKRGGYANFFEKTDVEHYLIDKIEINNQIIQKYYPSFFLGKQNYFKSINYDYFTMDNLFVNPSFNELNNEYLHWNKYTYGIKNVEANDFSNTLKFHVTFVVGDNTNGLNRSKEFILSNINKNLNENKEIKEDQINKLNTDSDFDANPLLKKVKQFLKKEYENEINEMFKKQEDLQLNIIANKNKVIPQILNNANLFIDDNNEKSFSDKFDSIKKSFDPKIFSEELKMEFQDFYYFKSYPNWSFKSRLFGSKNDEEKFVINYVSYMFDEEINLKINKYKSNPNFIIISINLKTEVGFAGNQSKTYDTTIPITLLKSQWEKK